MFERFTRGAREVVVGAQTEARSLEHGWIGTEHLLLAALADQATPVSQALEPLGLTHDAVRDELLLELGAGQDDQAALRDLGIDLDAVRRRVEERFGAGRTGRAGAVAAAAGSCGAAETCPPSAGRPGRRDTSRSPGRPRRRLSCRCVRRWRTARSEIRVEHLVLGMMRADGLAGRHRHAGSAARPTTYAGPCSSGWAGRPDRGGSADRLHDLVGDVEVGPDVLHVVAVLERVDQPEHLAGAVLVQRHADRRQERRRRPSRSRCPASCSAVRTATRSVASVTTSKASPRSLTSSAPASSTARQHVVLGRARRPSGR